MRPLIVALDVETDVEAFKLTLQLKSSVDLFKVGPVLFLKYGSPLILKLREMGAQVFLDMKFHDIPSVVQKAIERAGEMGVYSATIHTSGGIEMMKQAASAKNRPKLWGVTILTSLDASDLGRLGVSRSVDEQVVNLAKQAADAGLDGIVSSVREAALVREACGAKFEIVTPGIRLPEDVWAKTDDQKRAETPLQARKNGATFFVVGRPITGAKDPLAVVRAINDSIGANV